MKDITPKFSATQRFNSKYSINIDTGCWEWTDAIGKTGYGFISLKTSEGHKDVMAHRYSAKLAGMDIVGKVVRHTCHNKCCVNPDHLLTGSHAENSMDMVLADRQSKGEAHKISKLTESEVIAIRSERATLGTTYKTLGEKYNVTAENISSIVNRKTWNHVR